MDAGAVAPTTVGNVGLPQKSAEVLVDVPERQRLPGPAREEPVAARTPDDLCVVASQPGVQRRADGQLPVLAALRVADLQHAGAWRAARRQAACWRPRRRPGARAPSGSAMITRRAWFLLC